MNGKIFRFILPVVMLIFILTACGGFEIWVEVDLELPVIEFSLGASAPSIYKVPISGDEQMIYLGEYEVGLNEDAKNELGGRQITDMEISIEWYVDGLSDPVHVRVYMTDEEKTVEEITDDELFWDGYLENGEASETVRSESCPTLGNVIIPILNSEDRSGTIHVYLIHDYSGTSDVEGSLTVRVKKVKVRVF